MTALEHDRGRHSLKPLELAGSRYLRYLDRHNLSGIDLRRRGIRWFAGKAVAGFMVTLPIGLSVGAVNGINHTAAEIQTFMDEYAAGRDELYKDCLENNIDNRKRMIGEGLVAETSPIDIAGCHRQAEVVQSFILYAALSGDSPRQPQ